MPLDSPPHSGPPPGPVDLSEPVWLVLGGGGIRGLAHVGAFQAIREFGIPIAGIVGTSIGALVGAALAGGIEWRQLARLSLSLQKQDIVRLNRGVIWVNGIREEAVFRGEVLRSFVEGMITTGGWEDLKIPLQVNAVDLETGETEWFGTGARVDAPIAEACYASAALPVLFPPARIGGRIFVDGGTLDALPIHRARLLGAASILAVDVGSGERADAEKTASDGLIAIHERVFGIMSGTRRREQVERWDGPPLLYVRPNVGAYSGFAFDQVKYFLEEGYRATRAALAAAGRVRRPAGSAPVTILGGDS